MSVNSENSMVYDLDLGTIQQGRIKCKCRVPFQGSQHRKQFRRKDDKKNNLSCLVILSKLEKVDIYTHKSLPYLIKIIALIKDYLDTRPGSLLYHNGMLRRSFGGSVMFVSLQHFIAPTLT